ncbi:MAG: RNA polymerase sigma factor [Candidatus Omnitrophota bacterium]|jgi:RNA polymerase sigma-70 factor (ECF subfamily)|nr:MAG: RNA polymerase sigma factor [Candidatus Omnitrophota bacterium]
MELHLTHIDITNAAISRTVETHHRPSFSDLWTRNWPQSQEEFEAFVDVFQERIFRFLYYRLKNRQDAEDVLQTVFLKAYHDRKKLCKVNTRAGSYLFRMAKNACIDHYRKQKRMTHVSPINQYREIPVGTHPESNDWDELERIDNILRQIPVKQADVIRLRIMDDLSFSEIAEVTGCFETTVRTRYRYGVRKLRRIIQKEEKDR